MNDFLDLLPNAEKNAELLHDNLQWMLENVHKLSQWYHGMFLVIYKRHVIATFYNEKEAREWIRNNQLGGQASYYRCIPEDDMFKSTIQPEITLL